MLGRHTRSLFRLLACVALFPCSLSVGSAQPLAAFFVSPDGNDANDGTLVAPFATLERAQAAMQGSGVKLTYLRAGVYHRHSTLQLTPSDSGEQWSYYPPDGADTATIDGGFSFNGPLIDIAGASNVIINGLTLEDFTDYGILGSPLGTTSGSGNSILNCQIAFGTWTVSAIAILSMAQTTIAHNYIHDVNGSGVALYDDMMGFSVNGDVINSNVIVGAKVQLSAGGGVYIHMGNGTEFDHVTVSDNYIADLGSARSLGIHDIYLDSASNVTVTGNILRAPAPGAGSTGPDGYEGISAFFVRNGNQNSFSNNIVDLGSSGTESVAIFAYDPNQPFDFGMSGNTVSNNIILSNFTGPNLTANASQSGFAYYEDISDPQGYGYSIANNVYWNYATGGLTYTAGNFQGDASPLHMNPAISGWSYVLATNSPVYQQTAFRPIAGNWGPPNFSLPEGPGVPSPLGAASQTVPGPANAVGYTTRTFGPVVALNGNWFPWNFYSAGAQPPGYAAQNSDGSMFISGLENNNSGATLATAGQTSSGQNWVGTAFGGGAYFEATLSFTGQGNGPYSNGGPAFWALDIEHVSQGPYVVNWPGQAPTYDDYFEVDFLEYDVNEFAYQNGIGNWYGDHAAGTFTSTSNPVQQVSRTPGSVLVPSGTNFALPHKYGCLWVPATPATPGYLKFYFDGMQTGATFYWNYNDPANPFPPPPVNNSTAMSGMDSRHMMMILGTGTTQPMTVYGVSVWQKSATNNLVVN